ncbi:unnamed protein product [Rhodiola kirilowii]
MNRSFRAQESQMTVKQRQQVAASLRNSMMKEKEEDLALFLEMRKRDKEREKERDSLLLPSSNEFEAPLGSKPGTSPIFNIAASTPAPLRKTGPDDFLNSENDKNDYDWLLTPPGTPLFPSLESETQKTYMSQLGTPKGRSTSIKSRLANPQIEIPKRNSLVPKQPASCPVSSSMGTRRPSSSGGPGSRPATPTGRATLVSTSRPATPTGRPTLTATSRTSRPSTPTTRASLSSNKPTMLSTSRSAGPTRSTTPSARPVARSSTPTGRASIPASNPVSRASTPTRRPSASPSSANTSGFFSRSSSFLTKSVNSGISLTRPSGTTPTKAPVPSSVRTVTAVPKSSAPSRAPSPSRKTIPWKPSEMPGFSMEAPPNLRTSAPERPLSASRGRPLASSRSSSVEPGPAGRPKRQSCSPSRGRISNGFAHPSGSSVPALRRTPKVSDSVNPILMGTRMVDRVMNMRKLPPPQDDKSPSLSGKSASSPDSSGFGRNLSKKSLDMAIRHMDIRRSIPGNLRPLMTNIPASSMYSVRSGPGGAPTRGRTMSVSDSPLATSSNASSELSVNNNGLTLDLSELDDDNGSDRGVRTPSSICGR